MRQLISGWPQDTGHNRNDFVLVATTGGQFGRTSMPGPDGPAVLGAPGPENLASPIQRNATIKASLIDPQCAGFGPATSACARVRDGTPVPNGAFGTLEIRRRFTNKTGQVATRLRFRIVDITTLNTPVSSSPQADLRLLNSGSITVTTDSGELTVQGTFAQTPPAQASGGGLNTSVGIVDFPGTLAPNATVDVRFVLGVQVNGGFRFTVNVEALP